MQVAKVTLVSDRNEQKMTTTHPRADLVGNAGVLLKRELMLLYGDANE